jgi:hypothetical protein
VVSLYCQQNMNSTNSQEGAQLSTAAVPATVRTPEPVDVPYHDTDSKFRNLDFIDTMLYYFMHLFLYSGPG